MDRFQMDLCPVRRQRSCISRLSSQDYYRSLFPSRSGNVDFLMPASDRTMRQSESLPVVVCPGCKLPMALKERRRLGSSKLTTAVFRCAQCGMETERNFKDGAR